MNEKQIAFIICTNNNLWYSECVRFINELEIPAGYTTDVLCIQEADSITQGYNAGMQASEAKYKVYLHQDTFIINKRFIYDILDVFQKDETIGMLGVLGAKELSKDANCYLDWRWGKIQANDGLVMMQSDFLRQPNEGSCELMKAVDGMIIITQHDVPWREDILDGWDFYDVSQSLEMQRAGYKVVVPYQKEAWTYHDCGCPNLAKYDLYRVKMQENYPECFAKACDEQKIKDAHENRMAIDRMRESLISLYEGRRYTDLLTYVLELRKTAPLDTSIRHLMNLMAIYELEEKNNCTHSIWFSGYTWAQATELYTWLTFVIRRIEWGCEDVRKDELRSLMNEGYISKVAIWYLSKVVLKTNEKVMEFIE